MSDSLAMAPFVLLAQAENSWAAQLLGIAPFVVIGVLFYLMLVRPERRKRAELQQMLSNLKKNDRVVTIGGIIGTVVNAGKGMDEITLRVDDSNNTRLKVLRSSISRVLASDTSTETKDES